MTGNEVRDAALLYCRQVLARTAHYLDCARTDEGWVARVIVVEEKERKGAAGPKRWNMLYEIHLDPGGKPLYHLRLAPWNKAIPAPQPEKTPEPIEAVSTAPEGEGSDFPTPREIQDVARDPDLEGVAAKEATPPVPPPQPAGDEEKAEPEPPPRGEDGSGSSGEALGETPEESLGVALGETPEESLGAALGETPEESPGAALGETPEDILREALEEVVGDGVGGVSEDALESDGTVRESRVDDTSDAEGEEALTPDIGEAPHAEAGPKRPAVQERQGPPKVSFRFTLDDTIKDQ